MIEKQENKEYLPMQGLDAFRKATVDLLLGADNPAIKEVRLCNAPLQSRLQLSRCNDACGRRADRMLLSPS
jgi:hypothetical protein